MLRHVDHVDNESGMALAVAIYALVVVGALVSGAFFLGMQEQRVGRNSLHAQQAFMAAEGGAQEYMANWDTSATHLAVGDSLTFGGWLPDNVGWYRGSVLRINGPLFLVRSEGFSRDSLARQQVGALLRTVTMEMNVPAAIAALGGFRKESPLGINSGFDECAGNPVAGIRVPDGGLQYDAGDPSEVFEGVPAVDYAGTDTLAIAQSLGIDWEALLNATTFDYRIFDEMSFPDFSTLPADFYPSILVTGPRLRVQGPQQNGRGILVVSEELWINQNWVWDGVILVGNYFRSNGKMTISGTIVAGLDMLTGTPPADIRESAIGPGVVEVRFNTCKIGNTFASFSLGVSHLQERSWVDLN